MPESTRITPSRWDATRSLLGKIRPLLRHPFCASVLLHGSVALACWWGVSGSLQKLTLPQGPGRQSWSCSPALTCRTAARSVAVPEVSDVADQPWSGVLPPASWPEDVADSVLPPPEEALRLEPLMEDIRERPFAGKMAFAPGWHRRPQLASEAPVSADWKPVEPTSIPAQAAPKPSEPVVLAKPLGVAASLRRLRRRAARSGFRGELLLRVQVSAQGRPTQVRIVRSSGSSPQDQAVRAMVASWSFVPARRGDRDVPCTLTIPFRF